MRQLSPAGQQAIDDLAQRHGFSPDAVRSMLESVIQGNGGMAQFHHGEFGGSGQWMRGGMIMLSDMFNNALKGRVDSLCLALADLVARQPDLTHGGSFQSQQQNGPGSGYQSQGYQSQGQGQGYGHGGFGAEGASGSGASLFVPPPPGSNGNWWPGDLGWPNSTGAQNGARYAYFAQARRLAIDLGGTVTVYDTLDHQIGGFSQQQGYGGSLTFSSQYGTVDVASLPVLSGNGAGPVPAAPPPGPPPEAPVFAQPVMSQPVFPSAGSPPAGPVDGPPPFVAAAPGAALRDTDILATIEKLADLHGRGILSDQEFTAKKAELLARL